MLSIPFRKRTFNLADSTSKSITNTMTTGEFVIVCEQNKNQHMFELTKEQF